jgi:hypothetical protein
MSEQNAENCQYEISLGVHYHMRRQRFFETWHRNTGIFSLIFSTSAVAVFTNEWKLGAVLSAIVAILQCIDLMIDTRGKAVIHNDLRTKYLTLDNKILSLETVTDKQYAQVNKNIKSIEIQEPPVRPLLLELCLNDVIRKLELDHSHMTSIGGFKEFTANLFNWKSQKSIDEIRIQKEKEKRKKAKIRAKLKAAKKAKA